MPTKLFVGLVLCWSLACGAAGEGSGDEFESPLPSDCSAAWQDLTIEPTGGDPTGEWDIVEDCIATVGKVRFSPPCDAEDQASSYFESSLRGGFVLSEGQASWIVFESSRIWLTWPLECITFDDPSHDCEAFSSSVTGAQGEEIGWKQCSLPVGSDACLCYEEYTDHLAYAHSYRVEGGALFLGTDGYVADFSVVGDTLRWSRQVEGYQELMIARRRRAPTTEPTP